jgi:asparagine synthase (glutamine-hydrolysing)
MKQDQMSMSASLESRVPFLDHQLVEFVCSLPTEYKLKGFDTKRILRHSLGSSVPPEIVTRSKKGFPTPIKEWFRHEFASTIRELLQSPNTLLVEYIQPEYIQCVLQRHISGQWDLQEQIWTLANLELWLRIAIDGQDPETAIEFHEGAMTCASFG